MLQSSEKTKPAKLACWDLDQTLSTVHMHNLLMDYFTDNIKPRADYKEFKRKCKEESGACTVAMALNHFEDELLAYFQSDLLKVENIRHLDALAQTLLELNDAGVGQAVTSFTWFPQIAKPLLGFIIETHLKRVSQSAEVLPAELQELVNNTLDSFIIVGGFPSKTNNVPVIGGDGDVNHLCAKQQHMRLAQKHFGSMADKDTCLVDDSFKNVFGAKQQGYVSFLADRSKPFSVDYLEKVRAFCGLEPLLEIQNNSDLSKSLELSLSHSGNVVSEDSSSPIINRYAAPEQQSRSSVSSDFVDNTLLSVSDSSNEVSEGHSAPMRNPYSDPSLFKAQTVGIEQEPDSDPEEVLLTKIFEHLQVTRGAPLLNHPQLVNNYEGSDSYRVYGCSPEDESFESSPAMSRFLLRSK